MVLSRRFTRSQAAAAAAEPRAAAAVQPGPVLPAALQAQGESEERVMKRSKRARVSRSQKTERCDLGLMDIVDAFGKEEDQAKRKDLLSKWSDLWRNPAAVCSSFFQYREYDQIAQGAAQVETMYKALMSSSENRPLMIAWLEAVIYVKESFLSYSFNAGCHWLVVILLCPLFTDPTKCPNGFSFFLKFSDAYLSCFLRMGRRHTSMLQKICGYLGDSFSNCIDHAQNFLTMVMLADPKQFFENDTSSRFVGCATIIEQLWIANLKAQILPISRFQNSTLGEEADLFKMFSSYEPGRHNNVFSFPFLLDFEAKRRVLRSEMQFRRDLAADYVGSSRPHIKLFIRRSFVIEDSVQQILKSGESLKKELRVTFANEEGVDEGGMAREYFQLISKTLCDPSRNIFVYDEETRTFWFRVGKSLSDDDLQLCYFAGVILALSIYNSAVTSVSFAPILFRKLRGEHEFTLNDLIESFPTFGKSLQKLLEFNGDVEQVFCRSFVASTADGTVELVDDGANIPVTNSNREHFVELYIRHLCVTSVAQAFEKFQEGFFWVFQGDLGILLKTFLATELDLLISGQEVFNFADLEAAARYEGYAPSTDVIIRNLWEILHSLTVDEKKRFLAFTTGSDRVPASGTLSLVIARNGGDSDRLPTAHTCYNHFLLPNYSTKEKLRDRLLYAIHHHASGFGLR